jgi:hypothetical protein
MPANSTSFVMTNLQKNIKSQLGDLYGDRTWVEYGLRQVKQELGWTDYRLTKFSAIERWWEIIFCVYLMTSFQTPVFVSLQKSDASQSQEENSTPEYRQPQDWSSDRSWKSQLNDLRRLIQPLILFNLIVDWLDVFSNDNLLIGFNELIGTLNQLSLYFSTERSAFSIFLHGD